MNRIDQTFLRLRASERKGLIGYLTAGDPDLNTTGTLVLEMAQSGVDMVELGVPFSDPIADGPVIQASHERALKKGVKLDEILSLAENLRPRTGIPLLLMTYFNPIFNYGIFSFVESVQKSGLDGVIVPDLPLEESEELAQALNAAEIEFIYFLAPSSSHDRITETIKRAKGFIYCTTTTGVTGVRDEFSEAGRLLLTQVRALTRLPLALGFGISKPEQLDLLGVEGDAVIIGSAIAELINQGRTTGERVALIREFFDQFK